MTIVLTQPSHGTIVRTEQPEKPLLRREVLCAIPPLLFSRENFLSGIDNGRILQFRAGSGL